MNILGIETSCDETAIAVLDINGPGDIRVRSNIVSSQIKLHAEFGGVVPNLAAREHVKNISHVFETALKKAGISDFDKEIDLIAVTHGPGLGPALLVGIAFAKTMAMTHNKPLVGVNHMRGHMYSNWLNEDFKADETKFPILHLVVSGGHTELVLMDGYEDFKLIGETVDDAVGEAFDKVARLLGLGYPGGPEISKIALKGDSKRFPLPRPMLHSGNFNFSFSGLKTAVLYLIRDLKEKGVELDDQTKADIAASFQEASVDVLIQKTIQAAKENNVTAIFLSGGVSANTLLREEFEKAAKENNLKYSRPPLVYTGDNATMIALAAYFKTLEGASLRSPPFQPHSQRSSDSLLVPASPTAEDFPWQSVEMQANLSF